MKRSELEDRKKQREIDIEMFKWLGLSNDRIEEIINSESYKNNVKKYCIKRVLPNYRPILKEG